jgi:tRNA A-37 threonylcarbamoyl transferase component Bud32
LLSENHGTGLVVFKIRRGESELIRETEEVLGQSVQGAIHTTDWIHFVKDLLPGQTMTDFMTGLSVKRMAGGAPVSALDTSFRLVLNGRVYRVTERLALSPVFAAYKGSSDDGQEVFMRVFRHGSSAALFKTEKQALLKAQKRTGDVKLIDADDARLVLVQPWSQWVKIKSVIDGMSSPPSHRGSTRPGAEVLQSGSVKLELTRERAVLEDGKSRVFEATRFNGGRNAEQFLVFKFHPQSGQLYTDLLQILPAPFEFIPTTGGPNLVYRILPGQTVDYLMTELTVKRMAKGQRVKPLDTSFTVTLHNRRYQVTRLLGKGADGAAYTATDSASGHEVVLKVFGQNAQMYATEKQAMELIQERTRDVRLLDSDDESLVMVQRKIEGVSLASMLQSVRYHPGPLRVLELQYRQLTRSFYHQTGLLHGDVRPENVIYNPTNLESPMTLIDFARTRFPKGKKGSRAAEKEISEDEFYAQAEFEFSLMHFDAHVALRQQAQPGQSDEATRGLLTMYLMSLKNRGDHAKALDFAQDAVQAGNDWAVELFHNLYPDYPHH